MFKDRWFSIFGLIVALIAASKLEWPYLFLDFWNDELYTLEHFVFVPISTTLTDYHVPNNHILASLVFRLIAGVQGIGSIGDVIETPFLLRSPMLIFMLFGIFFIWKAGENIAKGSGWIGAIILVTSLPFLNFMTELRGYGLNFFFVTVILWLLTEAHTVLKTLWLMLCSAALVYTLPSNYYLLLGLIGVWLGVGLIKKDATTLINSFAMIAGVGLSLLFYAPIFKEVFLNEYVTSEDGGFSIPFGITFPWIWRDLFSYRILMLFIGASGLLLLINSKQKLESQYALMLFGAALIPFAISWLRVDNAPMRAFASILPVLALVLSIGVWQWLRNLKPAWSLMVLFVFSVEGAMSIERTYTENADENRYNIHHHHRAQNLKTKYYQDHYHPNISVRDFVNEVGTEPVLIHACEPHGIRHFLDHYQIPHYASDALDSLLRNGQPFYAVSSNPDELMNVVLDKNGTARFDSKSSILSYHNFIRISFETNQLYELAGKLSAGTSSEAILIAPSVSGLGELLEIKQIYWINSRSPESIKQFNELINALTKPEVYTYNLRKTDLLEIAAQNHLGLSKSAIEVTIDKSQNIRSDKPYSKAMMAFAHNDAVKLACLHWEEIEPKSGSVNAVFNIDRNGKNLSWQSILVRRSEHGKVYFTVPIKLLKTDQISAYLWLREGEDMQLSKTWLELID